MIIMMEMPATVMEETGAPVGAMIENLPLSPYQCQRMTVVEMNEQIEQYQLEQAEIERLEREKAEAEQQAREEAERARQAEIARQQEIQRRNNIQVNVNDVSITSGVTQSEFERVLANTGMSDVAWVFSFCEEKFGINGIVLAGLVALESGWGNSDHAIYRNNMTGYNIVSDSSSYSFASRADSVIATARLLANDYLNPEGRYYNGKSLEAINIKYCANSDWHTKITVIANKLLADIKAL